MKMLDGISMFAYFSVRQPCEHSVSPQLPDEFEGQELIGVDVTLPLCNDVLTIVHQIHFELPYETP